MLRINFLPVLFLLVLALSGCGFHLRGEVSAPEELMPVYVQGEADSGVADNLREILSDGGIQLAAAPDQARSQIRLFKERASTRVLAVDGQGKVVERELIYQLEFDVLDGSGAEMVPRQRVVVTRSQVNPDVEVLGKQQEAILLREDMEQEVSGRILTRIRARLR
jgi:LPS-assembly lipoprotein